MQKRRNRTTVQYDVNETDLSRQADDELSIDIIELLYRLLDRAKYIVSIAAACAIAAGAITILFIAPVYTATAKLYIKSSEDSAINLSDLQMGTYLASDYQEVFFNWHVHERVITQLGLPYNYDELSSMLTIKNPNDTRILYIIIEASSPGEAKLIADTYAEVAREFIAVTMDTKEPSVFEEALLPTSPSAPHIFRTTILFFALGFFAACVFFTIQYILDDKIRTAQDIENHLDIPVLGMMPMQQVNRQSSVRKIRKDVSQ